MLARGNHQGELIPSHFWKIIELKTLLNYVYAIGALLVETCFLICFNSEVSDGPESKKIAVEEQPGTAVATASGATQGVCSATVTEKTIIQQWNLVTTSSHRI